MVNRSGESCSQFSRRGGHALPYKAMQGGTRSVRKYRQQRKTEARVFVVVSTGGSEQGEVRRFRFGTG